MKDNKEFKYEVIRTIGVLSTNEKTGWRRLLRLISWNGGEAKYDLRDWSPDDEKMGKGVSLTREEAKKLTPLLNEEEL